jgi:hypothetical protein
VGVPWLSATRAVKRQGQKKTHAELLREIQASVKLKPPVPPPVPLKLETMTQNFRSRCTHLSLVASLLLSPCLLVLWRLSSGRTCACACTAAGVQP